MHKLLQRQLKQARQSNAGALDLDLFVELVDAAYAEVDRERRYTAHAHQVMRDEHAELTRRELATRDTLVEVAAQKTEAERARAAAEAELLKQERLSLLGRLTASIAHELRNPLSTLRNTMHTIDAAASEQGLDLGRQMTRIHRTIARCDAIITDLLDYASAREMRAVPLSLDAWLSEMLDDMTMPAGIVLEKRLQSGAVIDADCDKLRCALANVIENATEAIVEAGEDAGAGRIEVATSIGAMAEIVVTDSGPGISPEAAARAFEPLFSTRAFGTGLGLPTVKLIVEQHGGDIALGRRPRRGTRVVIRLPLRVAEAHHAA